MAALIAAREGLRVLLVDQPSFPGGTGGGAQVTPWMSNHINMDPCNEGLSGELQRDLEAAGQAHEYTVNPEALKFLLERKLVEAGVTLLYETIVIGVAVHADGALERITLATRQGVLEATADTFIDPTGDARVAFNAGALVRERQEETGRHQPMSLRFVMGGFELDRVRAHLEAQAKGSTMEHPGATSLWTNDGKVAAYLNQLVEVEQWPEKWSRTASFKFFTIAGRPGELWFNCFRFVGYVPLDPFSMSEAYAERRRLIEAYLKLLQRNIAHAEKACLVMTARFMGIRDGRRIEGRYILTAEDFVERRKFEDGNCANRYPVQVPDDRGRGLTEWIEMAEHDWHEIPYRCLIPLRVRHVLVAGRCISSDFTAQASYRIIPKCRTLDEAAGLPFAMAKASGIDPQELDGVAVH